MIDQVLNAIITQLNTYIGTVDPEVILGNVSFADAFQDNSSQNLSDKIIASVVNIEQEESLRNLPFRRTVHTPGGIPQVQERQPEIYLNIYVLFGANKNNYGTALNRISQVIGFFQRKFVFTATDIPVLATFNLDRIIFDLYSTSFEELNQLWSVMGGKYIPSVVYKMRLAVIQNAEPQGAGIITEINLGAKVLANQSPEK
jgi:hypothetical protein